MKEKAADSTGVTREIGSNDVDESGQQSEEDLEG
jgi:hypothetical protein